MTPLSKDKLNLLFLSIIIISGILLYLPSTSISFLNDEIAFIKRNQVSSLTELANLFDKKDYDGDYYRPFVNFTSGLITIAGGYNPVFYRIFNILLHTANGILVYFFILSLMQGKDKKDIISLFGALFFISFPLNDYSVIWHTDLFDRLMTSFYLLSLIFFIRKKTWGITSLIFFLLALLSKEMAFSLPFAVFLFSWFLNDNNRFIKAIKDSIPYIFILLILIFFRWTAFGNNIFNLQDTHSAGTLIDIIKNMILFAGMLVFPFYLRDVQEFILSYQVIAVSAALILFILCIYYVFKVRAKDFLFLVLILFIFIAILPASRLLMRWYMYLPSAGFCILLSYLIFTVRISIRNSVITGILVFSAYYSYTLYRETEWIKVSEMGSIAVENLSSKIGNFKNKDFVFLTVPAKVNDIPLFQLGFDHHLNHMSGTENNIIVLTKSYLDGTPDKIDTEIIPGEIIITHRGDNYFILSGIEKSIKFSSKDFAKDKLKRVHYKNYKEPDIIIFTFSEGKFHIIKE